MAVVSYLVYSNTLLQNATDILKSAKAILLQNARNFYYKNASKCDDFITQCGVYYKMPQCNGQCKVTYVRKGWQKHFFSCANIERFPILSLL